MTQPPDTAAPGVVPAQLGFLAIYNPSLGTTDETMEEQIVYYSSVGSPASSPSTSRSSKRRPSTTAESKEEKNERLRQIGLAQGMVEFGKSFSGDRPVDTIETEKARVVLHELEPGWWILASVDLTRLPKPGPSSSTAKGKGLSTAEEEEGTVEFSSREVKPASLLLQDLLRAHSIFLLHHDSSLSALFVRTQRDKFTAVLSRYWDLFLARWNVMLHGNPLRDVFGGIKIAASGELGVGVGEEDRGSGERAVLEGLVGRMDGLIDLVVGKFGDGEEEEHTDNGTMDGQQWLGAGREPGPEDGAIFLGVGALSRVSVRNISYWMEDLHTWGENAYGVKQSPTTTRSRPKRRRPAKTSISTPSPPFNANPHAKSFNLTLPERQASRLVSHASGFLPPPPIVKSGPQATTTVAAAKPAVEEQKEAADPSSASKLAGYLKLGYGTYWTLGSSDKTEGASTPPEAAKEETTTTLPVRPSPSRTTSRDSTAGHFLIGLMGNVAASTEATDNSGVDDITEPLISNTRTLLRTLTVELENNPNPLLTPSKHSHDLGSTDNEVGSSMHHSSSSSSTSSAKTRTPANYQTHSQTAFDSQDRNKTTKLRVLVYAYKPFLFLLLFSPHTDSLNWETPYRSLHHQLAPLRRPLLVSTTYRPARPVMPGAGGPIYELVYDAKELTVHSTLPHIPVDNAPDSLTLWPGGRVEALNTHTHLLNIFTTTRLPSTELERTVKTSRGWWVVWSRILDGSSSSHLTGQDTGGSGPESGSLPPLAEDRSQQSDTSPSSSSGSDSGATPTQDSREGSSVVSKEIFLVRKSGDNSGGGGGVMGSLGSVAAGVGGGGWTDGASRLAQGIGVDTRKYIEGLLSLNR
jgi:hypothetical protein